MKIDCISVSRVQCWSECEQRYKYRYHLEIASPEPDPDYFDYGKVVHKISETYIKNNGSIPLKDIMEDVVSGKIKCDDKHIILSTPQKKRLKDDMYHFMSLNNKIGNDGIVEKEFKVDLDPPNKKFVRGFIDRLITRGDEYFILDYKTTKKYGRKNIQTVTKDLQLQVYAWVIMNEYNVDPSKIKVALFYFGGGEIVAAQYTKKTLESLPKILLKYFEQIEQRDANEVSGRVGPHCTRCAYKTICPFYHLLGTYRDLYNN